jgi:hypothetical protein
MDDKQQKIAGQDDKDVEAHAKSARNEEPKDEASDDTPDVEGHFKSHSPKGASPKSV